MTDTTDYGCLPFTVRDADRRHRAGDSIGAAYCLAIWWADSCRNIEAATQAAERYGLSADDRDRVAVMVGKARG
jgi:hypothetical protein